MSSLQKALGVMAVFRDPPHRFGLTEIARRADLDLSATQRIVATLEHSGWLQRGAEGRLFRPGISFLEGAYAFLAADELLKQAMPLIVDLCREIQETVNVAVLDGSDIVYILRSPRRRVAYVATVIGRRVPALNTTSGRAIVSRLPRDAQINAAAQWPLGCWTDRTITDRDEIMAELDHAARCGYAVAEDQLLFNEIGIAAPIVDSAGYPVAAVQVSVSSPRWTRERLIRDIAPSLVDVAKAIRPDPAK